MRAKGTLLVVLATLLFAVSAWAVLSRIVPTLMWLADFRGSIPWGRLTGATVMAVLFSFLGYKTLNAGLARLRASDPHPGAPGEILKRRLAHWGLFLAMAFTVPVVFFLVQIVAVVPLAVIVFQGLRAELGFLIFGAIHTLIYAPVFWGISSLAVRLLMRVPNRIDQLALYAAALGGLIYIAWLGPYSSGGHSNDRTYTWLQTFSL